MLLSTNIHFNNLCTFCSMLINILFLFNVTQDVSDMFLDIMLCDVKRSLLSFYTLCSLVFIRLLLMSTLFLPFNILLLLFHNIFLISCSLLSFLIRKKRRKTQRLLLQIPFFSFVGDFLTSRTS